MPTEQGATTGARRRPPRRLLAAIALSAALGACTRAAPAPEHPATSDVLPHRAATLRELPPLPAFHGVRARDGARLDARELLDELSGADAVCFGESHDDALHHAAQLAVLKYMAERAPREGRRLSLGFEMVQRPFQPALDAYGAFDADESMLRARTEWDERWGFDLALYAPLFRTARDAGVEMLALNAPSELTRKVARKGLASLTVAERASLPELDLESAPHRAYFDEAMRHHPMKGRVVEQMYAAQVLWDETMAETAAGYLKRAPEENQVLIVAGLGHCQDAAIVQRLLRRVAVRAVSVRAVAEKESEPTDSRRDAAPHYDYDLVFERSPAPSHP